MSVLASLNEKSPKKDEESILTFRRGAYLIFVGLNAFSNEKLVGDHPHKECLWLHALAARGGHVVLCFSGAPEPEESIIQYAAKIALKNSHSQARTVCVSLLKDIYKPHGSGMGVWKSSGRMTVDVA